MDTGTAHLLEAAIKLECSLEVTARSLLLYHHFMRCAAEVYYDPDMIAAGALRLSGRLYEQCIDIDALICVFYSIVNQTHNVMSSDDVAYGLIKQTMTRIDFMMIRLLEFDINHRLAHQYLVPFFVMIFERSKYLADFRSELGRTCVRFMSDFYTQEKCLEFSPELIAISTIDLALYVHGLLNDLAMIPAWFMGFACDATPDRVKNIKKIILNLYGKFFIITPVQQPPIQAQQVVSSQPQQDVSAQLQQVLLTEPQQVMTTQQQQVMTIQPPQIMTIQPQQIMTTQPPQIVSTQVPVLPSQGLQLKDIESYVRKVVQPHNSSIKSPPVKQVLTSEMVQIEDMDISF